MLLRPIAIELQTSGYETGDRRTTSLRYYTQLFSLMNQAGGKIPSILDFPSLGGISFKLFKYAKNVTVLEIISEIMSIQGDSELRAVLANFFFNIFEYLLKPIRLLLLLLLVFFSSPPPNLTNSEAEAFIAISASELQERALLVLNFWVTIREEDFIYGPHEIFETIVIFVKYAKRLGLNNKVIIIRLAELDQRMRKIKDKRRKLKRIFQSPIKRIPSTSCQENCQAISDSITSKFLNEDETTLARILFIIDLKVFLRLGKYVFYSERLESPKYRSRSYGEYLRRFNTFYYWIIYMIIRSKDIATRANIIVKVIRIMRHMECNESFRNYEGIEHLKLALGSAALKNLKVSAQLANLSMSKDERVAYRRTAVLGSTNFSSMIISLSEIQIPCVPVVQQFVQFILAKDQVISSFSNDGCINCEKIALLNEMNNVISRVQHLETTKHFVKNNLGLDYNHELLRFFEKDFHSVLSCVLDVESLESIDTEKILIQKSKVLK